MSYSLVAFEIGQPIICDHNMTNILLKKSVSRLAFYKPCFTNQLFK